MEQGLNEEKLTPHMRICTAQIAAPMWVEGGRVAVHLAQVSGRVRSRKFTGIAIL